MTLNDLILLPRPLPVTTPAEKIPWNDPAFSQRMLENHLSQEHDWASRRNTIITRQTDWINQLLAGKTSAILDLGCGPGLYLQQLAAAGHQCTGIDFSPAAINYARQQAKTAKLAIDYYCEDIRQVSLPSRYDLVIMTFGEFNVFREHDAQTLLAHIHGWLRPGGRLILEVHTYDEVKRQGMESKSWETFHSGLFSAHPHLVLTENAWDETTHTASTTYWVLNTSGEVQRFASHMQAYSNSTYQDHLQAAGFSDIRTVPATAWPAGDIFTGKLYTYCCTKT